jgi:hypothetical protein
MSLRTTAVLSIASLFLTQLPTSSAQQATVPSQPPASTVVVPTGTLIPLNLISPIKHKSSKPGDAVRAEVAFPITVGDQIAIPAGTKVEGTIEPPLKGKKPKNAPPVAVHFTRLVYANGYSVALDAINTAELVAPAVAPPPPQMPEIALLEMPTPHGPSPVDDYLPDPQTNPYQPVTNPYAHNGPTTKELVAFTVGPIAFLGGLYALVHFATPHGDYVVESAGWQFQLTLQSPLSVDVARVNAAAATPAP